ncbi:hypothetical protein C8F04DRAFT_954455 [Mycena alexandri]|uniref:DUF6589 domain-containing protein n=1 Tax=Mycena alexandri TaxID=1745969 RepID=A0AAD6X3Z6_9AGAR|nr:hypothetical protein C8F04DRAFT_954455 [Mycena alexandri]
MSIFTNLDPADFYGTPPARKAKPRTVFAPPATPTVSSTPAPASSQKRLRAPRRTKWEKINDILGHITKDLDGLGNFLELLFYHRPHGQKDLRTKRHKAMVTAFLGGQTNVKMGHIIDLIYHHRQSQPPPHSPQRDLAFSSKVPHTEISFARPSLSSWALVLVGKEARKQIEKLTHNDPTDPADVTQVRASTNGRVADAVLADWDTLEQNLSIPKIAVKYKRRGPVPWYLTEMMAAPTKGGVIVVRQRRPHPTIQVGAISSFVLSRNRYASGYLALPLAIWQFACKSHVDEKRIFSRFGFTDHLDRVMEQKRKKMTTESLYADIDWIHRLTALHWVLILVTFIPQLAHLRTAVRAALKSPEMTKLRLRLRKSVGQPLGTNGERETETQGMFRARLDFEAQMGLDEKAFEGLIITPRGDGASIAAMWRIKKYLSAHPNHYKAFRNRLAST